MSTIKENSQSFPSFNLIEKYYTNYKDKIDKWLKEYPNSFVFENKEFNLKVGDVITFIGGYNSDIKFISKIFAFDSKTGNAYVYWDCYWVGLDLKERLVKPKSKIKVTPKIIQLNEKANKLSALQNKIIESIDTLNKDKELVFGYRSSCGSTDSTMKVFRVWQQVLKELQLQNIYLKAENLIVGNSYATLKGGFWEEVKYSF